MFEFKTKPYAHQLEIYEASHAWRDAAYFCQMGTGKTWVGIQNAGRLYSDCEIGALAIVAPKGVYRNWEKEIEIHLSDSVDRNVVVWVTAKTKRQAALMDSLYNPDDRILQILLMNVEALSSVRGEDALIKFLSKRTAGSMLIVDESTCIKTPKANRTKAVLRASAYSDYRRILTGSPITQSPLDLYTQCAALDPRLLGFESYYAFRNRHAVIVKRKMGIRVFDEVVGYQHLDELNEKLNRFSFRVTKEDCLDLPPKVYEKVEVEMGGSQLRVYNELREKARAEFEGAEVTVPQAMTLIMRLHQVCCGFVKTDDGEIRELGGGRIDEVLQILGATGEKAIIWATYRHSIEELYEAIRVRFGDDSIVTYYGGTNEKDRLEAIEQFQNGKARFFLGNPATAGYGLTLTAASLVIYFSNDFQLEKRIQSEDRAHRIGQEKSVTYVDIVCPGSVDERVLSVLRRKKNVADEVMGEGWRDWI